MAADKKLLSPMKHNPLLIIFSSISLILVVVYTLRSIYPSPDLKPKIKILPLWQTDPDADSDETPGYIRRCSSSRRDNPSKTFYDDRKLRYMVGKSIENWDELRKQWLKTHPSFLHRSDKRVVVVTGSQPAPCKSPSGDHVLLRLFKNKVDYCRIHGYDIFYNNAMLHPKMTSYWAKIPAIRSAMVAHPEAEWVWWVDSDAVFTDMDFVPSLERFNNYNLVLGGSNDSVYGKNPSSLGLDTGVIYIRNCQWSMDFIEDWAKMGPQTRDYNRWGQILTSTFKDKLMPDSDDQSAMIYLLRENKKWSEKTMVEKNPKPNKNWSTLVTTLENVTRNYQTLERKFPKLRRRHAEVVGESNGILWDDHLKNLDNKRPTITHFAGCEPCGGESNSLYGGDEDCRLGIEKALNFADNQVLKRFGFMHPNLLDLTSVVTVA
ncbi:galactomannan galactosyltransferase 1-like [Impatiens glandulifera]|uniref:galactomannan galactosyltransferase 1-like n=1 Tax=Impatiens glandulifera TaxID=253017 RepID=UPI001FB0CE41|nr:galactomannan galactosyltransferase 1-like [Impatiens glandulifera]